MLLISLKPRQAIPQLQADPKADKKLTAMLSRAEAAHSVSHNAVLQQNSHAYHYNLERQ